MIICRCHSSTTLWWFQRPRFTCVNFVWLPHIILVPDVPTCELNVDDDCMRALEREYVFIQILKNFREYTDESLLPFIVLFCFYKWEHVCGDIPEFTRLWESCHYTVTVRMWHGSSWVECGVNNKTRSPLHVVSLEIPANPTECVTSLKVSIETLIYGNSFG